MKFVNGKWHMTEEEYNETIREYEEVKDTASEEMKMMMIDFLGNIVKVGA